MFNVLGASSAVAILVGVRVNKPRRKLPWYLFSAGLILFVGGDVVTYNYQRFFHAELPFPSIGDVLYLAVYPLLVIGLLILIRRLTPGGDRTSLIDSLIITVGVALASWVFLMAPYAKDPTLTLLRKLISISYPLMDLLLLSVVVRLAVGPGRKPVAFYMLTGSAVALFVTDSIYGWILLHGNYKTGSPLDLGWIVFYLLWGAAALHPSMRHLEDVTEVRDAAHPSRRLIALAAAALLAPAVQTYLAVQGQAVDAEIAGVCSGLLFLLVLYRLNGLMVDVREYRRQEQLLRSAEARYRTLVEQIPAVVYVDLEDDSAPGRYRSLYVSPRTDEVLGYTADEWAADPDLWTRLLLPEDRDSVLDEDARCRATGDSVSMEYRLVARDGRIVWVRDLGSVMPGHPEGRVWHGVMFDVTELKVAEEELRTRWEQLQRGFEERSRLLSKLVNAQEEERQRIASDIHDDPIQKITAAGIRLDMLESRHRELAGDPQFVKAKTSIQRSIESLRHLMFELHPYVLDRDGFVSALRLSLDQESELAASPSYHLDSHIATEPSDATRIVLYRIAQEALVNVRKHAHASSVDVYLAQESDGYRVRVKDDGAGFATTGREHSPEGHLGVTSMRERAEMAGGWLRIDSAPGQGTLVEFWLPASEARQQEAV
jgi:PAS domain S-box-containing protein